MSSEKSIEPLSFEQIDFLLADWPDKNDLEPRPKQVIQAWRATSGTIVTRLVRELHEDASCHFRMPDTPPFLKDQKIQALVAFSIPDPDSGL